MARQLENIELVYINIDHFPQDPSTHYPVVLANSIAGDGDAIKEKLVDIYLTAFYAHNLPDWDKFNEALLQFNVKYFPAEQPDEKEEAEFSLDFRVKDATAPGGFLHRRIFKDVKIDDELELKLKLDEVDKKADIDNLTAIVTKTSIAEHLNLSAAKEYIKLGTDIYNAIAQLTLKDDPIWNEVSVVLQRNYLSGGAAALKQGKYAIIATSDTKGKNLRYWNEAYENVTAKGKHLYVSTEGKQTRLKSNYLIFELDFHD